MDTALFNIFDLPMVLAIFIGLILASVLLKSRPGYRHLVLATYLYALSFVELAKLIFWSMPIHQLFEPAIPGVFALGAFTGLQVPLLLYLYIGASTANQKPVTKADSWLLLIPLLGIVSSLLLYYSLGSDTRLYAPSNYHSIFFNPVFAFILLSKYGLFFVVAGFCLRKREQVDAELKFVFIGAFCLYSFECATDFFAALEANGLLLKTMGIFHNYMVLAYICMMLVYMLKQYFINSAQKLKKTSLVTRQVVDQEVNKLHELMMEHKYYLDSSINLEGLAKKLNMPEYQLSSLLNKKVEKNFFDFINYYRMEHAKKLMSSNLREGYSILDILYDSGFNSKSAFNRYFKKYTGITPSAYREKIKASG